LKSHDGGRTFAVIKDVLENDLGYKVFYRVIDASGWVPQHRERIYIVGFRNDIDIAGKRFQFPFPPAERIFDLEDVLQSEVDSKYILGKGTWETLERHREYHRNRGQGFGYSIILPPFKDKITRTLSARYHKDGAEILIFTGKNKRPRRLTPLECLRLQGFPKELERFFDGRSVQPVSDTQAYRQFGNSVSVPVVQAIARKISDVLKENYNFIKDEKIKTTPLPVNVSQ